MKTKAAQSREVTVQLTVNGNRIETQVASDVTLLHFLRRELRLTGTKEGCSDGHCGSCTVLVDGKAVRSCTHKVANLHGKDIETIEALSDSGSLHPVQEAFLSTGAVQCGFCTPGMVMATKAMLAKTAAPSPEQIRRGLKHNLCRCTGYSKIIDAVKLASELMNGGAKQAIQPLSTTPTPAYMGASLPDVDGLAKVKGALIFADDMYQEGIGYGKILWSKYPHAEILSIDLSEAEQMPGVRVVLTAKDVPGRNEFGILKIDQPVLADRRVRFVGDPVAVVIADSERIASAAVDRIKVEYRELQGVFSPEEALRPDSPRIYESGNVMRKLSHSVGDVERAFAESDLVIENDYSTPFIDHAFLEPESAVVVPSADGKLSIWTCTQMPFELRTQVAACVALPEDKVRVIATPLGGGFGGKISITVQAVAALGALRTGRPVKLTLTREESLRFHTKKHASRVHYKTGFTKDGKILANHARIVIDTGPYADVAPIVLDQASIFSCGPYEVPNVSIEGLAVYTNNANGGAMRGFGINQVAFAMEQQLDIAARKLGIDPFDLRSRNALEVGKTTITGETLRASVPIKETIVAAKQALLAMTPVKSGKKLGIGIASGFKNVGAGKGSVDNGGAVIELAEGGRLNLYVSSVDMGQGNRTAMVQLCAHEFGVEPPQIDIVTGDTDLVLPAVGVVGERATYCAGNAVVRGVREFKNEVLRKASQEVGISSDQLDVAHGAIIRKGDGAAPIISLEEFHRHCATKGERLRLEYRYVAPRTFPINYGGMPDANTTVLNRYASKTEIVKDEYRNYPSYTYITNVAIIEVDEHTGEVAVKKVITAVDVGKAINPQKIEGQIEGSIVMGMGYALSENYTLAGGIPTTTDLRKIGILNIDCTPEMHTLVIEVEDPEGPNGAKGISEVATVPITPAVINAIYDAVGVRIYDLPATKDKILEGLKGRAAGRMAN